MHFVSLPRIFPVRNLRAVIWVKRQKGFFLHDLLEPSSCFSGVGVAVPEQNLADVCIKEIERIYTFVR